MFLFAIIVSTLTLFPQNSVNPQKIVDKCIQAHGGKNYIKKSFKFDFRDRTYTYYNNKGQYKYTRQYQDGDNIHQDLLTNKGFSRMTNNMEEALDHKKTNSLSNSLNSVIYFAMIPYFLNDAAVNKEYLGEAEIKGFKYYKIQVTFKADGGGQDHDDIYVYWINKADYKVDYLGYSFHVNGGGVRFREAYNRRTVGGVIFQDYINYQHDKTTPVADLDKHYLDGTLKELSRIELQNVISY